MLALGRITETRPMLSPHTLRNRGLEKLHTVPKWLGLWEARRGHSRFFAKYVFFHSTLDSSQRHEMSSKVPKPNLKLSNEVISVINMNWESADSIRTIKESTLPTRQQNVPPLESRWLRALSIRKGEASYSSRGYSDHHTGKLYKPISFSTSKVTWEASTVASVPNRCFPA